MTLVPDLPIAHAASWRGLPRITHGFTGRRGGVSGGEFASLNLSRAVGDAAEAVTTNWQRIGSLVGHDLRFALRRQVHGCDIADVTEGGAADAAADALVTVTPGVAVAVLTADCVPILMAAPAAGVVAAVHAGWRGTAASVAVACLTHLHSRYGVALDEVFVALGPAIGACCYEVGDDVAEAFRTAWAAAPRALRPARNPGRHRIDLRQANVEALRAAGVPSSHIEIVGPCTSCQSREYYSHRASMGRAGRQASFIALLPS